MQHRTCVLFAFTLTTAMLLGVMAMAADIPKEGTFTGAYTGWGTYKATQIGPDRLLVSYDQNGVTLTNGFTDHMVWRCWGTADTVKGVVPSTAPGAIQPATNSFIIAPMTSTQWIRRPSADRA